MARVLIVDDSSTYRVLLRQILHAAGHEIVGEATDGEAGVALALERRPDLILMDVDMPGIDGLEATRRILASAPARILVLSGSAPEGWRGTLHAIRAGAMDFLPKPDPRAMLELRQDLLDRVGAILSTPKRPAGDPSPLPRPPSGRSAGRPGRVWDVVVVGSSMGGPRVLPVLFRQIPADYAAPLVVAQHMPGGWTGALAAQLAEEGPLAAKEAQDGERLQTGTIYLGPGGHDVVVTRGLRAKVHPVAGGTHPSVDRLFASAADSFGDRVIALVLTGMGTDGVEGARSVKAAGGTVLVQDEATAVIAGMPRAVAQAGCADQTLSVDEIAAYLLKP